MTNKLNILKSILQQLIYNIDVNNSNLNEEELDEAIDYLTRINQSKLSKHQACKYLGISRATFDKRVKEGIIPEGRKEVGFTEKFWYKSDLNKNPDS